MNTGWFGTVQQLNKLNKELHVSPVIRILSAFDTRLWSVPQKSFPFPHRHSHAVMAAVTYLRQNLGQLLKKQAHSNKYCRTYFKTVMTTFISKQTHYQWPHSSMQRQASLFVAVWPPKSLLKLPPPPIRAV